MSDNVKENTRTQAERDNMDALLGFHKEHLEVFGENWNKFSTVTMRRQTLSRILYYNDLYQKIVGVPGVICEFGVQWGATMAELISLRGMYEPFNFQRHIYGFDTFEGFLNTSAKNDGGDNADGDHSVYSGYEDQLHDILKLHEQDSPIPHIEKFSLIKGDVSKTVPQWIEDNPHAIVSMAIFDLDIYQPTRDALEAILPRLTKGSVLVFDELNCPHWPGETTALNEVIGLNNLRLQHNPHQPACAWAVWEG